MVTVITGITAGVLAIGVIRILKLPDTKLMYGLILAGIGFLYVGFVWTDWKALAVNAVQAIAFLLLAYYGVKRSRFNLAAGYFLHGCWDMLYGLLAAPGLIPPQYDWFCLSIDFTIGIYLLFLNNHLRVNKIGV